MVVNKIFVSARMLARLWSRNSFRTDEKYNEHIAQIAKHEAVFWEGLEEDDPINPKLEAIIKAIDITCRNIIAGKGTLHGVLNRSILKKS